MKALEKILVTEDEEDILTIMKIALENNASITVEYCLSGHEALKKAQLFSPDLILLDVMMPGMDGVATLKELRKLPILQNTPIVFMTAKVQPHEIHHYRSVGALDVIPKPFNPLTLADKLHEVWEKYSRELI